MAVSIVPVFFSSGEQAADNIFDAGSGMAMMAHGHPSPSALAAQSRSSASCLLQPDNRRGLSAPMDVPMMLRRRAFQHEAACLTQHGRAPGNPSATTL